MKPESPVHTHFSLSRLLLIRNAGAIVLLAIGIYGPSATAATIAVGPSCSLANAIEAANLDMPFGGCPGGSGADTIEIPTDSTQLLTSELPAVNSTITVNGNGSTIERSSDAEPFGLLTLVDGPAPNLTLNRLTLKGAAGAAAVKCGYEHFLTVNNSHFSANHNPAGGGAIVARSCFVAVNDSTFSGNIGSTGGAIVQDSGELTITGSTLSGNTATHGGGGGGGIFALSTTVTIRGSTITKNVASGRGGGMLLIETNSGLFESIVAGNTASSAGEISRTGGSFTRRHNNLIGHSGLTTEAALSGYTLGIGDRTATSNGSHPTALSGIIDIVLADNGGPTLTHLPVATGPAIDATDGCPLTPRDQRGVTRPSGAACDMGAVELAPLATVTALNPSLGPSTGGTIVTLTGTGFSDVSVVKFGPINATSFTINSATQITATTPAASAGMVNVTVKTPVGVSGTGAGAQFTYQLAVAGACGSAHGVATAGAPTANLCTTGTASAVSGDSHWAWTCDGTGGSTQNAICAAPYQTQSITAFVANPASVLVGEPTTLSASATSGLPVSFSSDTQSVCMVSGSTVNTLAAGNCIVRATQVGSSVGDSRFQAALPVTLTVAVRQNGACGAAHAPESAGTAVAPSANLCTTGAATLVSGSTGAWQWTCNGLNGGIASEVCSVPYAAQTLSLSVIPDTIPAFRTSSVLASSSANLPVQLSAGPEEICGISNATVTGGSEGSCTVTAEQSGTGDQGLSRYRAAPRQIANITVLSPCEAYRDTPNANIIDLRGAPGGQTVRGVSGRFNVIFGSDFADTVTGGNAGNCIDGRGGSDRLTGGAGENLLIGGPSNDTLTPGSGSTAMHGGPGTDRCGRASGRISTTYQSCESN